MVVYAYEANGLDYHGDIRRFTGEWEFDYGHDDAPPTDHYIKGRTEIEAAKAAYRVGVDPDTIEITDIMIVDQGPRKRFGIF